MKVSCVFIYVRVIPNRTLDEAINRAFQLEAIYEAENGRRKQSKQPLRVQSVTPDEVTAGVRFFFLATVDGARKSASSVEITHVGRTRGHERRGRSCWHCGEKGHLWLNCPKRLKSEN